MLTGANVKRIVLAAALTLSAGISTSAFAQQQPPTPDQIEAYQQGLVRGAAILQQQIDAREMAARQKAAEPPKDAPAK